METETRNASTSLARVGELARALGRGEVSKSVDVLAERRIVETFARARRSSFQSRAGRLGFAAAMMIAAIVISALELSKPALSFTVEGSSSADAKYISPAADKQATVLFSEGTEFVVQPGARLRIADVGKRTVEAVIESGSARIRTSGRPVRWKIDVGPFAVSPHAVASLMIEWLADELLRVRIFEGETSVDGTPSPLFLHAGQQLSANTRNGTVEVGPLTTSGEAPPSATSELAKQGSDREDPSGDARTTLAPSVPPTGAGRRSSWADEVALGDYAGVLLDAERRGIASVLTEGGLSDLVALADAARLSGRIDLARRTLLAERGRFPRTSAAKDAAFFLGRMTDDHERALESALDWYDTYLSEAPAGHFAAEAFGRKMVVVSRLSGPLAARATASEYLKRFPSGPHAALARELLSK